MRQWYHWSNLSPIDEEKLSEENSICDLQSIKNNVDRVIPPICKKDNGKWFNFNDTNVSEIGKEELVSKASYCLFYKKI